MRTPRPLAALALTACLAGCSSEDCRPRSNLVDRPSRSLDCAPNELCYLGSCRTSCNAGEACSTDSDCPAVRPRCAQGPAAKLCTSCDPGEYCVAAQHICAQLNVSTPQDPTDPGAGSLQPDDTKPTPTTPATTLDPGTGTPKGPDPYPDTHVDVTIIAQHEVWITGEQAHFSHAGFPASAANGRNWFIDSEGKLYTDTYTEVTGTEGCRKVGRSPVTATAADLGPNPTFVYFPKGRAPGTTMDPENPVAPSTAEAINTVLVRSQSPVSGPWSMQRDLPGQPTVGDTEITGGNVVIPWTVTAALPGHVLQLQAKGPSANDLIICHRSLSDRVTSGTFVLPTSGLSTGSYTYRLHALRESRVRTDPKVDLRLRLRVSSDGDQSFQIN